MPEVLRDAGVYFDPENGDSIARVLRKLIAEPDFRAQLAQAAFDRAQSFSWGRCADETFEFMAKIAREPFTGNNL
jgi:glycosyltransferase involved in cell wall biosynthesis